MKCSNGTLTFINVEDDQGHAVLLQRILKRVGVENSILHFKNGETFLKYCYEHLLIHYEPDMRYVIFLDIRMPKIDGIEVLEQIKTHEELRKIPVIMLTTTGNQHDIDICYAKGCNSYICKPYNFHDIQDVLKNLIEYFKRVPFPLIKTKSTII